MSEWAKRRARDVIIAYQKTPPDLGVLEALIIQALVEAQKSAPVTSEQQPSSNQGGFDS